jgi:hypothetical protein
LSDERQEDGDVLSGREVELRDGLEEDDHSALLFSAGAEGRFPLVCESPHLLL